MYSYRTCSDFGVSVTLAGCKNIRDLGVGSLFEYGNGLRYVDLSGCSSLSDYALRVYPWVRGNQLLLLLQGRRNVCRKF